MTQRNLTVIQARLTASGLAPLLERLSAGPLTKALDLSFSSLKKAKEIQRLLYHWLWFFPAIKAGLKIKLNDQLALLTITPLGISEKRGRKGAKK